MKALILGVLGRGSKLYILLALAVALAGIYGYHRYEVNQGYKRGIQAERLVWQEVQRKAEAKRAEEKAEAERRLAEIEAETGEIERKLRSENAALEARLAKVDDKVCLPAGTVQ